MSYIRSTGFETLYLRVHNGDDKWWRRTCTQRQWQLSIQTQTHTHTETHTHTQRESIEFNKSRLYSLHTWFFIKQISPPWNRVKLFIEICEITTPRGVVLCRREKFKRRQQNNFRWSRNVIRHNSWELIALEGSF